MSGRLGLFKHGFSLLKRPTVLVEAIRAAWEMRRNGRPTPSKAYVAWRLQTAYGDSNAAATSEDMVHYLTWRRQLRRISQLELP